MARTPAAFAAENERRRWQRVLDGVTLPQMLAELAAALAVDPALQQPGEKARQAALHPTRVS